MLFNLFTDPVKKAAIRFFNTNRFQLFCFESETDYITANATEIVYSFAYDYCTENNLHLSTIYRIKKMFAAWAEKELENFLNQSYSM